MTNKAVKLLEGMHPDVESIKRVANFLELDIEKVQSIEDLFDDNTIFAMRRPNNIPGMFGYIAIQPKLAIKTPANQYRKFFQQAAQAMKERGQTNSDVDFILVVGEKILILFDSSDFRRRLILTPDKISRENSKYLLKLNSLKAKALISNKRYTEDDFFGDIELDETFKTELFRFAIADDEQFIHKTKIIRLNFWKRIEGSEKCHQILRDIFFKETKKIDPTSDYWGDIISAVLDTLVLRYILVRILEDRFGYANDVAKKYVSQIGLGTTMMSMDELLETKAHFDSESIKEFFSNNKKAEQLTLFEDLEASEVKSGDVDDIRQLYKYYMTEAYGGDLYISDIAKAATKIEETLTGSEYTLIWNITNSNDLDFDLGDVTPATIGEQYEQTLQMKLKKTSSGTWEYSNDNSQQRSQGSFYTNAQITDYIIEQTLGKKLREFTSKLREEKSDVKKKKILKNVLQLRIADITSGGGTFLAGAVRKLGNWYNELENWSEIGSIFKQIKEYRTVIDFQKYAVNHMIYGIDSDLKALIVSSFALTLESLGDTQEQLPKLIDKTLVHQNSLISTVPESLKIEWFKTYREEIKSLIEEKRKWTAKKKNTFNDTKKNLQNKFKKQAVQHLLTLTKKYPKDLLESTIFNKHMEVLEFNLPEVFFDGEGKYIGGFDIIVGNPPYIQLQKKGIFSDAEKYIYQTLGEFCSYKARGDIYTLFFERGIQLLKPNGLLGFITSNKYLRAEYGKPLRNYLLDHTNPYLLVNLGSGMFGATVDTSILAIEKAMNTNQLKAVDLVQRSNDPKERLENMSDYIEQNKISITYAKGESWTILSEIEQSIKSKIETVGTPLKDWDISINYGIKTGYNDAFIIDVNKRNEILKNCKTNDERQRTADLIRPILRGRDIKRYGYEFADLYLICTFPSKHYDINSFPAIKNHLLSFGKQKLAQTGEKNIDGIEGNNARKKTNNKWFETQDSIAYWDDFNKPKLIWKVIGNQMAYALDKSDFVINNACYMLTGSYLEYLTVMLNSDAMIWYSFITNMNQTGVGDVQVGKQNIILLPIPKKLSTIKKIEKKYNLYLSKEINLNDFELLIRKDIAKIYNFNNEELNFLSDFKKRL